MSKKQGIRSQLKPKTPYKEIVIMAKGSEPYTLKEARTVILGQFREKDEISVQDLYHWSKRQPKMNGHYQKGVNWLIRHGQLVLKGNNLAKVVPKKKR